MVHKNVRQRNTVLPLKINKKCNIWYCDKPNISHLKIFSCIFYVNVPDEQRKKSDDKSVKGALVGYNENEYRVWFPSQNKVEIKSWILVICFIKYIVIYIENIVINYELVSLALSLSALDDESEITRKPCIHQNVQNVYNGKRRFNEN